MHRPAPPRAIAGIRTRQEQVDRGVRRPAGRNRPPYGQGGPLTALRAAVATSPRLASQRALQARVDARVHTVAQGAGLRVLQRQQDPERLRTFFARVRQEAIDLRRRTQDRTEIDHLDAVAAKAAGFSDRARKLADDDLPGAKALARDWIAWKKTSAWVETGGGEETWATFERLLEGRRAEEARQKEKADAEAVAAAAGRAREARRQALIAANDAVIDEVRKQVVAARRKRGQQGYNAGSNPGLTLPGGTNNPIVLDRGDPNDGFTLRQVATGLDASDSGVAKRRFAAAGSNILVHVK